ncbi:AT-rich interactive domain-containing protein 2-like [Coffea arabica]|uniref:AT-rich interactive domain-containing protein 2-like n=1 Tax=Coffea arabica TaxID=13443 RepID=A0A6P6U4D8_COFAR
MEGWSNLRDESGLREVKIIQDCERKKESASDHDFSLVECGFDECKNRLRGLFNDVLVNFLRERSVNKCIRPLPVLCANDELVDLFKLFWVVRKLGGYDSTSRKNLWGFVAEECGLGFGAVASVKLIYVKYLNELDHWLWQGYSDSIEDRFAKNLDELVDELRKGSADLMEVQRKVEKEDVKRVKSKFDKSRNATDRSKRSVHYSSGANINEVHDSSEGCVDGGEKFYLDSDNDLVSSAKQVIQKVIKEVNGFSKEKTCDDDNKTCSQNENDVSLSGEKVIEKAIINLHDTKVDTPEQGFDVQRSGNVMLSTRNAVDKVVDSRKRKRESSSLSAMLSWVKNTAKHPDDLSIGRLPECSKWKRHGNREPWFLALLAREARLIKRDANLKVESSFQQKKLRMHPSMYEEDVLNHQSVEKSRCSQRLPVAKCQSCSCCNLPPHCKVAVPQKAEQGYSAKESLLLNVEDSDRNKIDHISMDDPPEREVCVGPEFQAEVPEWTGVIVESDPKWVGKQMWPPEDVKDEPVFGLDRIGKGRPNACDCPFPGNVECIRFHIAEKRLKLKRELGLLFYKWRFDHMGEEVSLSWTAEHEKKFKDMIRLNSASTNKFWSNAFRIFPSTTRDKLVSYYFNVFLVRRRSYQNRVTPKDVDSDDDERECGLIGDSFGYKAIYVPESRLPICFENKQCAELD